MARARPSSVSPSSAGSSSNEAAGIAGDTSAAVMVPLIVPDCGQVCVPAGPFPRFVQRNTEIPPLTLRCPK
jgi:hypothetical protein